MNLRAFLQPAWDGMRANFVPGLVLQGFALAVVLSYFQLPEAAQAFDALGRLKAAHGYLFSAVSTAIFGALLPFGFLLATGQVPAGVRVAQLLFYLGFWIWKGVEVDAFYRFQALLFGDSAQPAVIAWKTLVDQFLYNPLWAAPTQTAFFLWKDSGFSLRRARKALDERSFLQRSVTILVSTWIVWVPAVAIIYALPGVLQLPLFNLVLCFWCLMLSFVSRNSTGTSAQSPS